VRDFKNKIYRYGRYGSKRREEKRKRQGHGDGKGGVYLAAVAGAFFFGLGRPVAHRLARLAVGREPTEQQYIIHTKYSPYSTFNTSSPQNPKLAPELG
jgi:hypothetical protein